jgi:peroxiredoxin
MAFTLSLKAKAPDFSLKGTDGKKYSLKSFADSPILVLFFTCNHCPYVIASDETTRKTALKYKDKGVAFVAINSNTPDLYEEDSFDHMVERMNQYKFPWVYLVDPTQETARAYGALRTPHFYIFDSKRQLVFCGCALDDPLHPEKCTTNYVEDALDDLLAKKPIREPLTNPIGCSVKWKGHDAHWMPDDACDLVSRK